LSPSAPEAWDRLPVAAPIAGSRYRLDFFFHKGIEEMRTTIKLILIASFMLLLAGQFFPPERTNPPVNPAATFEAVAKPSPAMAGVVKRACHDCHSHSTAWPWYSRFAPGSWLVADDVKKGRARMNFSEWANYGPEMSKEKLRGICSKVKDGEMPLWQYRLLHPEAKLSAEDVNVLCAPISSGNATAAR
jgi:hypothetical protein